MTDHAKGVGLVILGVSVLAPDAALIRLITADTWTLLFWRGLGFFSVLAVLSLLRYGTGLPRQVISYGWTGLAIAVCFSACQMSFVNGVELTNPAHVLVLVSATPIFAGLFSRLLLGERLTRATALAIAFGMVGVLVTLSGSLTGGGRWQGDLLAAVVPISLGLAFTLTRRIKARDTWALYALAGLLTALVALVPGAPLSPRGHDIVWIGLLALVIAPGSFALISLGPRFIPAAEVSLLMLLETILGPIWVWLVVSEVPTSQALIGGLIILTTLALHTRTRLRTPRPAPA
jgi:drug/metabolite transporter (DMT)-like permease